VRATYAFRKKRQLEIDPCASKNVQGSENIVAISFFGLLEGKLDESISFMDHLLYGFFPVTTK
jgi:hypothetical protein